MRCLRVALGEKRQILSVCMQNFFSTRLKSAGIMLMCQCQGVGLPPEGLNRERTNLGNVSSCRTGNRILTLFTILLAHRAGRE